MVEDQKLVGLQYNLNQNTKQGCLSTTVHS